MSDDAKTKPLMTKAALLERIKTGYNKLEQAFQSLSEQDMLDPRSGGNWSWKDTLAHIAAWEEILVRFHIGGVSLDEVIGMEGVQYGITSFEDINAHLFQRHQHLTTEGSRDFLRDAHERVMEAVESFPEESLHQIHPRFGKDPAATVTWIDYIAANTYEHYEEHLAAQ